MRLRKLYETGGAYRATILTEGGQYLVFCSLVISNNNEKKKTNQMPIAMKNLLTNKSLTS